MAQAFKYFSYEQQGEVVVIAFTPFNVNDPLANVEASGELIQLAEGEKIQKIVVDFRRFEQLSDLLVETLLRLKHRLRKTGGDVILCCLQPAPHELLCILNLAGTVFQTMENVDEAVQSFSSLNRLAHVNGQNQGDRQMPQLVNSSCTLCGERISSALAAEFCEACGNPVHHSCRRTGDATLGECFRCGARVNSSAAVKWATAGAQATPSRRSNDVYRYSQLPHQCPRCGRKFSEVLYRRLYRRRFRLRTIAFFVILGIGGYTLAQFIGFLAWFVVLPPAAWAMAWHKKVRVYCSLCGWAETFIVTVRG